MLSNDIVKLTCEQLDANTTLTKLNIESDTINPTGAAFLSKTLSTNKTIASLNLRGNVFGVQGATTLANALESNTTLSELLFLSNFHFIKF
jgi:Ran GTPase-activating protein (RanGAP) involved in mRNA processing and transport